MIIPAIFGRFAPLSLAVLLLAAWAVPSPCAETAGPGPVSVSEPTNNIEMLRSFLLLQEQIHDLQMKLDSTRQETSAAAQSNSAFVASRLQTMEDALRAQRLREVEQLRETNRTILMVAAGFAGFGLLTMLVMAYLQWRTINRVTELSSTLGPARLLAQKGSVAALGNGTSYLLPAPVEQSNARLQDSLKRIEERLQELEASGAISAGTNGHQADRGTTGKASADASGGSKVDALLAKGQSLLGLDKPEEALKAIEEALTIEPNHPDGLVKKGMTLERMGNMEGALECYEKAIVADPALTVAYLCKGGLCNRMQRFSEAVQCYERALRAQNVVPG